MTKPLTFFLAYISLFFAFVNCAPQTVSPLIETAGVVTIQAAVLPSLTPSAVPTTPPTSTPWPTLAPPATATNIPTSTPTSTPPPTLTPTITPTITPAPICTERMPSLDDLWVVVTYQYGLSQAFAPQDLVLITDHFEVDVTKGYPSEVRQIILDPLKALISAMQEANLEPQIISGYRSYSAQNVAYTKWLKEEPERATMLSARPGHSEHQLGTTVDFGSPNLHEYVEGADETIEFHTYFYKTPEGQWLLDNAHLYGFTLSYPREAQELTGFYYEPWHYRYVGVEMATFLKENNLYFTAFQLASAPPPCTTAEEP